MFYQGIQVSRGKVLGVVKDGKKRKTYMKTKNITIVPGTGERRTEIRTLEIRANYT